MKLVYVLLALALLVGIDGTIFGPAAFNGGELLGIILALAAILRWLRITGPDDEEADQ